ncbi:MAG TPA: hypothetical protein PKI19_07865 [Elusimicrobiales bacterium]|nr:hypothetical protein [Elusimicrobiales bacterium]
MEIIIHRGAGSTQGSCVELVSGRSRILLDYGAAPQAAPEESVLNIPGLYDKAADPILALLVSHTHWASYGALLAKPLNPGIKIFMTEIMEDVIRITAKMRRDGPRLAGNIHHFRKGHKFIVGRFVITPYLMDHSAAESFAFLIESEGKRVIYTGDFRDHGNKAAAFKQFLAAKMGPIDALITAGARAGLEKGPAEQEVMGDLEVNVKRLDGALFVMCAGQDIGLLTSLANLAQRTRRYLVVDGYTALLLERMKALALKQGMELKIPGLDTEYLRIIRNDATQRVYQMSEYTETFSRMRPKMFGWDWVRANLNRLIIPVRGNTPLWVKEQINDLRGAALVYSAWDDCGDEDGMQQALDWFRGRGLADVPAPLTSHAYFSAIRKLAENKRPRYMIPVNTDSAGKFTATFGKRARVLANGEEFALD